MAYRRKQASSRSSTFEDYTASPTAAAAEEEQQQQQQQPPSLAAQAIRASSAHRDSSLSSAYGESAFSSVPNRQRPSPQDSTSYEYTSMKSLNESKHGFWGVLARKAKSIIEDDHARQLEDSGRNHPPMHDTAPVRQLHQSYRSSESYRKTDNQAFHKGSETLAYIGGTIKNAFEEGLTIVENRTADIIEETRKLQIRRKSSGRSQQNPATDVYQPHSLAQSQYDHETQLKASRDVANAMAAKAKLLLRELKTVKADLAFAKERCAQLEEENKILRESREKGDNTEDDDLIRLQLETLLSEKGRLAHENSVYARENRFLREIVEYHQLTMQDVVYLDEGNEEVTEVCSIHGPQHSPTHSLDEESSPVISGRSTPTSKPTTPPSPNRVVSPETFPVMSDPPNLPSPTVTETSPKEADSTSSRNPTAKGARQQHTDYQPSPTPRAVDSARPPNCSPTPP